MPATKSNPTTNMPPPAAEKKTTKRVPAPAPAPAPVAPPPPPPAPVAEPVPVVASADDILASLHDSLKVLSADVTARVRELVRASLEASKAIKRESRAAKRRVKVDPATLTPEERVAWEKKRANNAFLKLRPLSDELSAFLGLPAKSQRSQTDVTKAISAYVKDHGCFDPSFKRRILPDTKLAKLLRVKDTEEVTYLNLQTYLKVHFLKPEVVA